ncbi:MULTISPECIES: hypothetical protein [unclassified Streptomyces]|uniref:hypothetical protein n=1 Tax=unclassified Streptomyces TaxID=2593676 RepID=UPI0035DA4E22
MAMVVTLCWPDRDDSVIALVASTCATARCSSQYRSHSARPYASSAVTHGDFTFTLKF